MSRTFSTATLLPVNPGLRAATRVGWLTNDVPFPKMADYACLALAAFGAAAASTLLDFNLRIPGHAILRVAFPLTAGLALVPRRGAGTVMGALALLFALAFRAAGSSGEGMSLGALTSLTATGPFLDWTLRRTRGGWKLYLACGLAGLVSNTLALAVRGGAKLIGWEHAGGRPLGSWLAQAGWTYPLCGLVAGVVSGVVWFYARRSSAANHGEPPA